MEKLIFNRGSSFLIRGLWRTGPEFTDNTEITAVIDFSLKSSVTDFDCLITLENPRNFEIYASNTDSSQWPIGFHTLRVVRRDENHFSNGDPFVDVLDPVQLEVR